MKLLQNNVLEGNKLKYFKATQVLGGPTQILIWGSEIAKGEWHSGLMCYIQNHKDPGSNSTQCLARLWDLNLYQSSQWPSGWISIKHSDEHQVCEAAPLTVTKSWSWGSQVADKKMIKYLPVILIYVDTHVRGS